MNKDMFSTDHTEAKSTGENNKLPAFPMNAPKDDFNDFQKHAERQTKYLKMHNVMGGRRRRRKSRKKKHRRRRRSRRRRTRRRQRRQRGGQKGSYGKPGIGSEDSLCGAYQTPDETQYTPDKYIVVPQPGGSSGGALAANDITVNLAKALTQARANSEGDFSVVNTTFQDDREKIGMGSENEKVAADKPPPEIKLSGTSEAIKAAEGARAAAASAAAAAGGVVSGTDAAKSAAMAAAKAIPATKKATAEAIAKINEAGEKAKPGGGGLGGLLGSAAKAMDPTGGLLSGMLGGGRRKSRRRRRKSRKKKHQRRRRRRTRGRRRLRRKSRRR